MTDNQASLNRLVRLQTLSEIQNQVQTIKKAGQTVGFVPTMGALHAGHLSLIAAAQAKADVVICSIFVNPTQFNEKSDLVSYPRTVDADCELLESVGCQFAFLPAVDDIYPDNHQAKTIDYHGLDVVMEGASRPGHFDGVVEVVARLFDIVQPDFACFGEKDFQQLAVVSQLVEQHDYPIEIIPCAIMREAHGLAMSSRNERLSPEQRQQAAILQATLKEMKALVSVFNPDELAQWGREQLEALDYLHIEYLEVAESRTLTPIYRWQECEAARGFVAARFGEVRLIDNMDLYRKTQSA